MYGWNERPTKATTHQYLGGDKPAAVYEIGLYQVTVYDTTPGEHPEVTYCHKYRHTSDPRSVLPNMDIADGEIRIPLTDLVGEALKRLEPVELAKALWQDDDVRAEFMECLVTRWSEQGIGDADRRKFLHGVQEAVRSKAVDELASTMAKLEYEFSKRGHYYHEVNRINGLLRELDIRCGSDQHLLQFEAQDRPVKKDDGGFERGELEIGGKSWEEARAYWRAEVAKRFPAPSESIA